MKIMTVAIATLGFPRIGPPRELKAALNASLTLGAITRATRYFRVRMGEPA